MLAVIAPERHATVTPWQEPAGVTAACPYCLCYRGTPERY